MDEREITCFDCGCIISEGHATPIHGDNNFVCPDCRHNYFVCDECGELWDYDSIEEIGRRYVCPECRETNDYFQCDDCGAWYRRVEDTWWNRTNYFITGDNRTICQDCYIDNYECCNDCGEIYSVDDMTHDENEDGHEVYYCADCERSHKKKYIKNYSYKPSPIFKTGNHDKIYSSTDIRELVFGVELEIDKGEDPEETAGELCEASEDIYCKHDGSLNNGVEIVTHPCTLDYHLKDLGWGTLCDIALKHGFRSNDARTCGLHVHVGRRQLGSTGDGRNATIAKMILLVQRHWDSLVTFTRRSSSQLDRWAVKPDVDLRAASADELVKNALRERERGRYVAVNLQNSETVEFRLFNGSLKLNTIYATLQFVSNLCLYAKNKSVDNVLASQWNDICRYQKYDELAAYLRERSLDNVPHLEPMAIITPEKRLVDAYGSKLTTGDIVRVINDNGGGVGSLYRAVGETARVICEDNPIGDYDMGIQLLEQKPTPCWHNLNGRLPAETGYWVHSCNVEFVRHETIHTSIQF